MKKTIIICTLTLFSLSMFATVEAADRPHKKVVVIKKPVVVKGYWKWNPKTRKRVWIKTVQPVKRCTTLTIRR